jgi:hypothetical protein
VRKAQEGGKDMGGWGEEKEPQDQAGESAGMREVIGKDTEEIGSIDM